MKINWTTKLQDRVPDVVDADGSAALLAKGVGNDYDTVVLYGGNNNWFAAYAYWRLQPRRRQAARRRSQVGADGRTLTEVGDREPTTYAARARHLDPHIPQRAMAKKLLVEHAHASE